jgi:hypothetical protein
MKQINQITTYETEDTKTLIDMRLEHIKRN